MIVMIMVMAVVIMMMKMTILLAVTTTLFSSSTVSLHDMFSPMVMMFSSPHAPPRCRLRNSLALVLQHSRWSMTLLFFTSG